MSIGWFLLLLAGGLTVWAQVINDPAGVAQLGEQPVTEEDLANADDQNDSGPTGIGLCDSTLATSSTGRLAFGIRGSQPTVVVTNGSERSTFPGSAPSIDSGLLAFVEPDDRRTVQVLDLDDNVVVAEHQFEGTVTDLSLNRSHTRVVVVEDRIGDSRILLWNYLNGDVTIVHDPSSDVAHPKLSPDGESFLWAEGPRTAPSIYLADLQDFVPVKVVESGEAPSWTPDGSAVVFSGPFDASAAIFRAGLLSGDVRRLTSPMGASDSDPAVSPDCSRLVFMRAADGQVGLWSFQNGMSSIAAESVTGAEYGLDFDHGKT